MSYLGTNVYFFLKEKDISGLQIRETKIKTFVEFRDRVITSFWWDIFFILEDIFTLSEYEKGENNSS